MPSVSGKQHRAMEAAAHGRSTLGIPKNVAEEFVKADKAKNEGGRGRTSIPRGNEDHKDHHRAPNDHGQFEKLGGGHWKHGNRGGKKGSG